ncbi:MAG: L-type lectin-domain containing protein [Bacteroidia bacterium]
MKTRHLFRVIFYNTVIEARLIVLLAFITPVAKPLVAQRPTVDDFTLRGSTYLTDDYCFRLTEDVDYTSGSIWYKRPVSLMQPFVIELSIMAGCQDAEGADGMVFVFTPFGNQLGYVGEGMGFAGMVPSVGIEVDTWRNYHLNDPEEDHVAIMANGRMGHYSDLAGPQPIVNIEDCTRHRFVVVWQPAIQRLSVEIDNVEIIAATYDLVGGIFGGNDEVYWGVTAATGRYNNIHEVCFDRLGMGPEALPRKEPVFHRAE